MPATMFGSWMRQRRLEMELTQEELEARAGLKQTNISQIERGEIVEPGPERLAAIAIALGVELSDLVELTEQRRYHVVRVDEDARMVPVYGYIPADIELVIDPASRATPRYLWRPAARSVRCGAPIK